MRIWCWETGESKKARGREGREEAKNRARNGKEGTVSSKVELTISVGGEVLKGDGLSI